MSETAEFTRVKYLPVFMQAWHPDFVGDETASRISEDITDAMMDRCEAEIFMRCGMAGAIPYTQTNAFRRRMARAKTELERSELETLKLLMETYQFD